MSGGLGSVSQRARAGSLTGVDSLALAGQVASDWDSRDQAQSKLYEYQWKILTEQMSQISSLVDGVAVLRQEVQELRGHHQKSLSSLNAKLGGCVGADVHAEAHADVRRRLEELEGLMGEASDSHGRSIDEAHSKLNDVHGRQREAERRMELLERSLGESTTAHGRHASDLELHRTRLQELFDHVKDQGDARERSHGELLQRLLDVESYAEECSQRHTRDLHGAMQAWQQPQESWERRHSGVDQRVQALERLLGDTQSKHGEFHEALQAHGRKFNEEIKSLLASQTSAHGKLQQELLARIASAHGRVREESEARERHHATVQQRLDFLERAIGDSADKHQKSGKFLEDLRRELESGRQNQDGRHSSLTQRLERIERLVQDVSDKHMCEIEARDTRSEGRVVSVERRLAQLEGRLCEDRSQFTKELQVASSMAREQSELRARIAAVVPGGGSELPSACEDGTPKTPETCTPGSGLTKTTASWSLAGFGLDSGAPAGFGLDSARGGGGSSAFGGTGASESPRSSPRLPTSTMTIPRERRGRFAPRDRDDGLGGSAGGSAFGGAERRANSPPALRGLDEPDFALQSPPARRPLTSAALNAGVQAAAKAAAAAHARAAAQLSGQLDAVAARRG
eukprot:TRINITY_DN27003_c0_g1_i1.p1 TRINITY_DN27003_c0_g1~~TRINITY_DN27003_c0_g1_i1.p1  ORF type:complete len:629 (-),score=185.07 TRINITY_DN27003_c0_g1_i1:304-2190(-)